MIGRAGSGWAGGAAPLAARTRPGFEPPGKSAADYTGGHRSPATSRALRWRAEAAVSPKGRRVTPETNRDGTFERRGQMASPEEVTTMPQGDRLYDVGGVLLPR